MKLPRDIPADRLIRVLKDIGYLVVRQKGSHARLKHEGPPPHYVTVPMHNPLKTGTLHAILVEVADKRSTTLAAIVAKM